MALKLPTSRRGARLIFADKRAVKQILVNLLSNGVKFTPRGGEVRVTARADAAGIEIAVRDTGTGISKADLERLGQPFEQVESAADPRQGRHRPGPGAGQVAGGDAWRRGGAGLGAGRRHHGAGAAALCGGGCARASGRGCQGRSRARSLPFRGRGLILKALRMDMTTPRLKAGIFVRALIRRAEVAGASAFVVRMGSEEAGAVILRSPGWTAPAWC